MFDIKEIRDNPQAFDAALAKRGVEPKSDALISLDEKRRAIISETQEAQTARNKASKKIGKAKASGDEELAAQVIAEVGALKAKVQEGEEAARQIDAELHEFMSWIPNLPLDDVPVGADEEANEVVRTHGQARELNFEAKEHFDIGEGLGLMDFEAAAKMSGARFVVLKSALARLERAIASFMLDVHTSDFGYTEVSPPLLVRDDAMFGTGQLPKFRDDQFNAGPDHWLVPTAEVPLTNLVRESILSEEELPLRFTAYTPCFRLEAGSAGRDTRGMIRMHQFPKVELVSVTRPEDSLEEHERMTSAAEEILKRLDLHYRVMVLSTGDMGFSAQRTYDLEVWLPGQNAFREISSCSVCGSFQARRMNARYRPEGEKNTRFVHTLNGSGVAVGRAMVAILETYQQADGSVTVPDVLKPYMGGLDSIQVMSK
ncbi:MAG: serine--tRNA ligase [Alphaproteobacteria bacterium]|nr:MAG: serine--tRNA ligase [Alphaproteobacteria bacterium]